MISDWFTISSFSNESNSNIKTISIFQNRRQQLIRLFDNSGNWLSDFRDVMQRSLEKALATASHAFSILSLQRIHLIGGLSTKPRLSRTRFEGSHLVQVYPGQDKA